MSGNGNVPETAPMGPVAVEMPEESHPEPQEPVNGDSAKLLRITVMSLELLDEVRHMPLDDGGRKRLRAIHEATVGQLRELLPDELRRELETMALPLEETASESEVRLAQVQLVGWLEGLMHGIQAALWTRVIHAMSHARRLQPAPVEKPGESEPGQYL